MPIVFADAQISGAVSVPHDIPVWPVNPDEVILARQTLLRQVKPAPEVTAPIAYAEMFVSIQALDNMPARTRPFDGIPDLAGPTTVLNIETPALQRFLRE